MKTKEYKTPETVKIVNVTLDIPKDVVDKIVKPYKDRISELEEQNQKLLDDAESEKISRMQADISYLNRQLSMSYGHFDSEKELKAYRAFCKKHSKCMSSFKINNGKVPYIVENGNGIGTCKKVVCQVCGESKEITDISVW